jgi:hypothetical protein
VFANWVTAFTYVVTSVGVIGAVGFVFLSSPGDCGREFGELAGSGVLILLVRRESSTCWPCEFERARRRPRSRRGTATSAITIVTMHQGLGFRV